MASSAILLPLVLLVASLLECHASAEVCTTQDACLTRATSDEVSFLQKLATIDKRAMASEGLQDQRLLSSESSTGGSTLWDRCPCTCCATYQSAWSLKAATSGDRFECYYKKMTEGADRQRDLGASLREAGYTVARDDGSESPTLLNADLPGWSYFVVGFPEDWTADAITTAIDAMPDGGSRKVDAVTQCIAAQAPPEPPPPQPELGWQFVGTFVMAQEASFAHCDLDASRSTADANIIQDRGLTVNRDDRPRASVVPATVAGDRLTISKNTDFGQKETRFSFGDADLEGYGPGSAMGQNSISVGPRALQDVMLQLHPAFLPHAPPLLTIHVGVQKGGGRFAANPGWCMTIEALEGEELWRALHNLDEEFEGRLVD